MQPSFEIDVFISRKSQDAHLAKEVYDFLTSNGLKVFDSDHTLTEIGNADYSEAIDEALTKCKHLIVISSQADYVNSEWVKAEWRFFLNQKRSNKKSGNLLTIITGQLTIDDLPASLQNYEVIPFDTHQKRILSYLGGSKKIIINPTVQKEEIPIDKNENTKKQTDNRIHTEENYLKGKELYDAKEYSDALIYLMQAANEGHAEGQNLVGYLYQEGHGVNQNHQTAMKWYRKAADQGLAEAEKNIGRAYNLGLGMEKDYDEAMAWYLKAANKNNGHAWNNIGLIYEYGYGVSIDNEKAFSYYLKSIEFNFIDANFQIGTLEAKEKESFNQFDHILKRWLVSAKNGNNIAEFCLGYLNCSTNTYKKDFDEAFLWFEKSAKQDNPFSQLMIGKFYNKGYYVEKNIEKAKYFFRKAAVKKLTEAYMELHYLYLNNSDKYNAELWLTEAEKSSKSYPDSVSEFKNKYESQNEIMNNSVKSQNYEKAYEARESGIYFKLLYLIERMRTHIYEVYDYTYLDIRK